MRNRYLGNYKKEEKIFARFNRKCWVKVDPIFSDSKNIFLWYESEDINKKSLFPKFKLIPI